MAKAAADSSRSTTTTSGVSAAGSGRLFLLALLSAAAFASVVFNRSMVAQYYYYYQATTASTTTATVGLEQTIPSSPSSGSSSVQRNNRQASSAWVPTDDWIERCVDDFDPDAIRPFFNNPEYDGYRLGDCVRLCLCWGPKFPRFENSLASEYGRRACGPNFTIGGDMEVLMELFRERRDRADGDRWEVPGGNNEVVVHLRLGDVIEGADADAKSLLTNRNGTSPRNPLYPRGSIKSVHQFLSRIYELAGAPGGGSGSGSSRRPAVTIVGGSHRQHRGAKYRKSRIYAGCLRAAVAEAGYDVSMRLDANDPDRDFYYMANAGAFIPSLGGYSTLIARLVNYRGGRAQVFTPSDERCKRMERRGVKIDTNKCHEDLPKWLSSNNMSAVDLDEWLEDGGEARPGSSRS